MRRILVLLATMAAAVLVASGLALAAPPVTETHTFTNTRNIAINDGEPVGLANPYPSEITVSGFPEGSRITDVNLSLNGFTHEFPFDVNVLLVAPSGATALVMSDAGFDFPVSRLNLVLDDDADSRLPGDSALGEDRSTVTYKPANYRDDADTFPDPDNPGEFLQGNTERLSVFNRTDPNGIWQLYIVDDFPADPGSISGWSLTITATS